MGGMGTAEQRAVVGCGPDAMRNSFGSLFTRIRSVRVVRVAFCNLTPSLGRKCARRGRRCFGWGEFRYSDLRFSDRGSCCV